jgi:hypothetical protein
LALPSIGTTITPGVAGLAELAENKQPVALGHVPPPKPVTALSSTTLPSVPLMIGTTAPSCWVVVGPVGTASVPVATQSVALKQAMCCKSTLPLSVTSWGVPGDPLVIGTTTPAVGLGPATPVARHWVELVHAMAVNTSGTVWGVPAVPLVMGIKRPPPFPLSPTARQVVEVGQATPDKDVESEFSMPKGNWAVPGNPLLMDTTTGLKKTPSGAYSFSPTATQLVVVEQATSFKNNVFETFSTGGAALAVAVPNIAKGASTAPHKTIAPMALHNAENLTIETARHPTRMAFPNPRCG